MGESILRRYTDVTALTYLLTRRRITLLDPQTWDDKNDSYYLRLYKTKSGFQTVLALCFAQAGETYHHWRVFANGSSGVCIHFKRKALLEALEDQPGIHLRAVKYLTLKEISARQPTVSELPFLKRFAFEDESEFRIIYESKTKELRKLDLPIPLSSIKKVILSPWLHPALSDPLIHTLRSIPDCKRLQILRSSLISNERWKTYGENARKASRTN